MKKLLLTGVVALGLLGATACETTSSRPYTVSTQNVMAFQKALGDDKVQVGTFALADGVSENMTCRALGALEVAPGKTPVEFIEGALRDELFAAGAIDADGTQINGVVEALKFNSFGTGSWDIKLKLSSDANPTGYTVETKYSFKTSFSAISACQNVIDAFTPAVQDVISKAVSAPEFKSVAGTTGSKATS